MGRITYSLAALSMATAYWLFDSLIHYLAYAEERFEWIPSETNELWMRSLIFVLLVAFGVFTDFHLNKVLQQQRAIEKAAIFHSTLRACHYIINNFLHQMQVFRLEAEKSRDFDRKVLVLFDAIETEAADLLNRLQDVTEVSEESIEEAVRPR